MFPDGGCKNIMSGNQYCNLVVSLFCIILIMRKKIIKHSSRVVIYVPLSLKKEEKIQLP